MTRFDRVDHLLLATPDLEATVAGLERLTGVRPSPGGRHPAWSTRNAIMPLGPRCYLEVFGPDPDAPAPTAPRPLDLDGRDAAGLATWVANGTDLETFAETAAARGIDLGTAERRSRHRPDGLELSWTMTDVMKPREGGVVPFFIDWGETPHPGTSGPVRCRLVDLRATHPDAERVQAVLGALGLDLLVEPGAAPGLTATLETPAGRVVLGPRLFPARRDD